MTAKLQDRKILVTGAASGMGREIAGLFAQEGASLALLDRNEAGVTETAKALSNATAFQCDVANRAQVNDVIASAAAKLGGLDGIVNAAGILDTQHISVLEPESFDRMMAVNVAGPFNIVKAALPFLTAAERATIVNIASVSGLMPMPGTSGYSATKAAVLMFTKCLGMDLGPKIRANCVCPGFVRTEMTRLMWENPEHAARAADRVALKRHGMPEDIARAVLFFTTEDSGYTTGTELVVDGGFSWR